MTHLGLGLWKGKPGCNGRVGASLGKVLEGWDRSGQPGTGQSLRWWHDSEL